MAERKTCKSKNASRESGFRHRQNKETQLEMVDNSNKLCECGSDIERELKPLLILPFTLR